MDFDTLHDSRMMAAPSMLKAIRTLIDTYDVYFVADAPANRPERYAAVSDWLCEYVNVPAYNHIIFTNYRHLLYGDYYISTAPPSATLATAITYGSDTFKTWEEVITFFKRLQGE